MDQENEPEGFTIITYTPGETSDWRPSFFDALNATWVETWEEVEELLVSHAAGQNLDDDRALRNYPTAIRDDYALDYPAEAFDVVRPSAWVFPGRPRVILQDQKAGIISKAKERRRGWEEAKARAEAKASAEKQSERDKRDREELDRLLKRREKGEI